MYFEKMKDKPDQKVLEDEINDDDAEELDDEDYEDDEEVEEEEEDKPKRVNNS